MVKNLNTVFQQGVSASKGWTQMTVHQTLESVAKRVPGSVIDWEPGDEEWGRVIDAKGEVLALVCARIPVGAVRNNLIAVPLSEGVNWISFESIDEPEFSISQDLLVKIFGREMSTNVDYSLLSINDLWWATVS